MLLMIKGVVPQICMTLNWKVRATVKEDFEEKASDYQWLKSLIKQRPSRRLTQEERLRALGMLQVGTRQVVVARAMNVSQSVISRLWSRHRATGYVQDRPRSGSTKGNNSGSGQIHPHYCLEKSYGNSKSDKVSTSKGYWLGSEWPDHQESLC
ncbi:hypothetical protein GJAV_G00265580, partial [Gymnothorax javanicus]